MAVRIPIYEDRLTPQGGLNVQDRVADFSDAVGRSMQNLGQAGVEMGGQMLREERFRLEKLKKKEDDDAVVAVGSSLANASAEWPARVDELARNSTDGGVIQDGEKAVPMTQKLQEEFSGYREKFLAGVTNPKARQYAEQHLNSLWAQTYSRSLSTEAQLGVQNRMIKVDQAVETYAGLAAKDPSQVKQQLTDAKTLIANSGADPASQYRSAVAATKKIVEAAVTGELQRNPEATRAALLERWGVSEKDMKGDNPPPMAGKLAAGFDGAVAFTLAHEGGMNAKDTNGAPSNMGINAKANPDVDVANLTKGQAVELYRKRYWNAIGGDALNAKNPALATVAFDTAVIAGPGKANELMAKADGDPAKLLQLREEFQASLLKKDPGKFGPYKEAWAKRNDDLRAVVGGTYTQKALPASSEPAVVVQPYLRELVGMLEPDRVVSFQNAAQTEVNRVQTQYRAGVASRENDQVAMYMNGEAPQQPLTEAEYIKAYGAQEGSNRYRNFQSIASMGSDLQAMKLQTPDQPEATVQKYKPTPNTPDYDLANKRYNAVTEAANRVRAARAEDPIQFAQDAKISGAGTINWNDTQAAFAELKNRAGLASTLAGTYQTPFRLLSKVEAGNLSAGLQRLGTEQKLAFFSQIARAVPDASAQQAIFQQIAPDSPLSAVAGRLAAMDTPGTVSKGWGWWRTSTDVSPRQVASMIMRGEELLNPNKADKAQDGKPRQMLMPSGQDDKAFRDKFVSTVGKSFAGQNASEQVAYQAVRAYYAAAQEKAGDFTGAYNSSVLEDAIEKVIGGVSNVNSKGEVRRPWGMPEDKFTDAATTAFNGKAAELGLTGKDAQFRNYGLVNNGDGYLVFNGLGFLTDKAGQPVKLDVAGSRPNSARPATVPNAPAKDVKPSTASPNTK